MDVLTNFIGPITSQYICASNHHMYTLNIHDAICQSDLNMLGEKNKSTDFTLKREISHTWSQGTKRKQFNKQILRTHFVLENVQGARDITMKKE